MILITAIVGASSDGKIGSTLKNGNGCDCHGPQNQGVTVVISGPSQLSIGETAEYDVVITGGPLSAGGINIASANGTLTPKDGLKKLSEELTHTSPKIKDGNNRVKFEFLATAPQVAGQMTLFATGNSVNLNGNITGDAWNHALSKEVNIIEPSNTEDNLAPKSFSLYQNYPNPFNPVTTIRYTLDKNEEITLKVYNISGNEVAEIYSGLMNAGEHQVVFDASALSSGVYFYTLATRSKKQTLKMILMK